MDTKHRINPAVKELAEWGPVTALILSIVVIIKKLLRVFFRITT